MSGPGHVVRIGRVLMRRRCVRRRGAADVADAREMVVREIGRRMRAARRCPHGVRGRVYLRRLVRLVAAQVRRARTPVVVLATSGVADRVELLDDAERVVRLSMSTAAAAGAGAARVRLTNTLVVASGQSTEVTCESTARPLSIPRQGGRERIRKVRVHFFAAEARPTSIIVASRILRVDIASS